MFDKFKHIENQAKTIFWRLDGEEWTRFLDYIHGPDRQWTYLPALSWFCCRRRSYERLMNRQYGHIILCEHGFIIDELHFISFRSFTLASIEVQNFGQDSSILGLRLHGRLSAGKSTRSVDFDLFAPSSIRREQLHAITEQYKNKIPVSKV
ncbi:unnamed protein product [Rotaria sp. Silwood2]|nr:unnamed protein product [Rotaria sp. Silwood2]CAF4686557.1 unnamed protein product [Rotaria sp. Silwood2]